MKTGLQRIEEPSAEVLEVYLSYLDRLEAGEELDYERFCAEHPELADELLTVRANWRYVESLLDRTGLRDALPGSAPIEAVTEDPLEVVGDAGRRDDPFARYRLHDVIARGGMATVWRVWDRDLSRFVAMKVLDENGGDAPGVTGASQGRRLARFLEEARVAARLDHPGIAPVYELGMDEGRAAYFTMKLVDGRTFLEVIDQVHGGDPDWTLPRALGVLSKVCEAVAYAHERGIVHRDLKPANVMVGRFGAVFVVDWGLARILDRERAPARGTPSVALEPDVSDLRTLDGDVIGTPAYMAPEQAAGRSLDVDARADVYALGAVLYHLLAGHPPYADRGARPSAADTLAALEHRPPRAIGELVADVPAELLSICDKAMARDRALRYADVQSLAADLRAYLEGRVVHAYRTGPIARLEKWVMRNKPLAATILVVLLLTVVGSISAAVVQARRAERERVLSRFSALDRLQDLERQADELWPVSPARIEDYRQWLREAEALRESMQSRPGTVGYEEELAELRESASVPEDEELIELWRRHPQHWDLHDQDRQLATLERAERVRAGEEEVRPAELHPSLLGRDPATLVALAWPLVHPTRSELGREEEGWAMALSALERAADPAVQAEAWYVLAWAFHDLGLDAEAFDASERACALGDDPRHAEQRARMREELGKTVAERRADLEDRRAEVVQLGETVTRDRGWTFDDSSHQVEHDQVAELVGAVADLFDPEEGLVEGTSPSHGWGIGRRLELAVSLETRSLSGPLATPRWQEAIDAIRDPVASPHYRGLEITRQVGLLPIGRDPVSGLQEFAHLQSGEVPVRGPNGQLVLTEKTGMVLVLLPGGEYRRGSQRSDPGQPNYDPRARDEHPVHVARMNPFFLSKYEMTQGQWRWMTGKNPSRFCPGYTSGGLDVSLLHPVEEVSWEEAERVLAWMGLRLPTEAQWEYAARGHTATSWWTGDDAGRLRQAANLMDRSTSEGYTFVRRGHEPWSDGFDLHAPIGSFEANAFGLHDILGNVREWCHDAFQSGYRRWGLVACEPVVDPRESRWRARLYRMVRGGGFASIAEEARSAARSVESPDYRDADLGLRPARSLDL